MRILQLGISPLFGGVESFIINYWEQLRPYNIEFDFVCMYDHIAYEDRILATRSKILYVKQPKRHPIQFYKQLIEIAKNYDVVHINMLSAANSLPIYACKKAGVKNIIVHSHNSKTEGLYRYLLHYLNKIIINRLDIERIACSKVAARWMFFLKNNSEYFLIHNAIDLKKYKFNSYFREEIRNKFLINENITLIGSVGHLTLQKNPIFLLEVMKEILKINKNTRLIYVGAGDLERKVKEKAAQLQIEKYIIYTGVRHDVEKFYSAFDVFCMTSLYEGLSFTAVEAQASGIKCFFSTGISNETQLLPETEFLEINDARKWAQAITKKKYNRNDKASEYLRNKGFDIKTETVKLAEYYLKMGE